MKLKLDLHTHCFEALCIPFPKGINSIMVGKILAAIKASGLDGIAITEHYREEYGFEVKDIVSKEFNNQVVIIPGREVFLHRIHVVELFLPNRTIFRFIPHPLDLKHIETSFNFGRIHGIEIANRFYDPYMDKHGIEALAKKHCLLLLCNSDAHELSHVGYYHNEIDLDDLQARVRSHPDGEIESY